MVISLEDKHSCMNIIEDDLIKTFVDACRASEKELYISKRMIWVNGAPSLWPYGIIMSRFEEDSLEEQLQETTALVREGKMPKRWMIGPASKPLNFHKKLADYGFVEGYKASGMVADLKEIDYSFMPPNGFEVRIVDDDKLLYKWAKIVVTGLFNGYEAQIEGFYNLCMDLMKKNRQIFFIGMLKGEPAAAVSLHLSPKTAGIYHVAVLPQFRCMGIGKQMMLAALIYARNMGHEIATLQASEMGKRIYTQLGFRVYCDLLRYWYKERE